MVQENSYIKHQIAPSRIAIATVLIIAGIALTIMNFTPNEAGVITISLQLIALEILLVVGGIYAFIQGFKTKFCSKCNKALEFDSKLYDLQNEQKLMNYLTKHDKNALIQSKALDSHMAENALVLTMEYCKFCKSIGIADLTRHDENGKPTILLKNYRLNSQHFE